MCKTDALVPGAYVSSMRRWPASLALPLFIFRTQVSWCRAQVGVVWPAFVCCRALGLSHSRRNMRAFVVSKRWTDEPSLRQCAMLLPEFLHSVVFA